MAEAPRTTLRTSAVELTSEQMEDLEIFNIEPGAQEKTESTVTNDAIGGLVTTTKKDHARIILFSPEGVRKSIPLRDAKEMRLGGYVLRCPKCGNQKCGGVLGGCPTMAKTSWTRCPIPSCGRIIKDQQFEDAGIPPRDEGSLDQSGFLRILPHVDSETRLTDRLRTHMVWRHPREARLMFGWTRDDVPVHPVESK